MALVKKMMSACRATLKNDGEYFISPNEVEMLGRKFDIRERHASVLQAPEDATGSDRTLSLLTPFSIV